MFTPDDIPTDGEQHEAKVMASVNPETRMVKISVICSHCGSFDISDFPVAHAPTLREVCQQLMNAIGMTASTVEQDARVDRVVDSDIDEVHRRFHETKEFLDSDDIPTTKPHTPDAWEQ